MGPSKGVDHWRVVGKWSCLTFPSRDRDGRTNPLDHDTSWACAHAAKQNSTQVCHRVNLSAESSLLAWLLPVFDRMGLSIFAQSCLCFRTVLSLEKSFLLPPGFLLGVGYQEVQRSFGPLSPAAWPLLGMVSSPMSHELCLCRDRDGSIHVVSAEGGSLLSLKAPEKPLLPLLLHYQSRWQHIFLQLLLLAPDTAGVRWGLGLDAKALDAVMGFHSLPLSDFTSTVRTPRQIENCRQTQILSSLRYTHSGSKHLSSSIRALSLFAAEVLSFSDDRAVNVEPGLSTLRRYWIFNFAPQIPAVRWWADFHPGAEGKGPLTSPKPLLLNCVTGMPFTSVSYGNLALTPRQVQHSLSHEDISWGDSQGDF